jgi:hypothetical protein
MMAGAAFEELGLLRFEIGAVKEEVSKDGKDGLKNTHIQHNMKPHTNLKRYITAYI